MDCDIKIYDRICRTCLKMDKNLINVFECFKDNKCVSDILMECITIKVQRDDSLPTNICNDCLEKLIVACDFKALAIESNQKLHNFSSSSKNEELEVFLNEDIIIKEEPLSICCDDVQANEKTFLIARNEEFITAENPENELQAQQKSKESTNLINCIRFTEQELNEEETNNDDIKLEDIYNEDSLSIDFNNKKECNQIRELENICYQTKNETETTIKCKEVNALQENIVEDSSTLSLEISEYEHLRTTLSKKEKNETRLYCNQCKKSYRFYYYFQVHLKEHAGQLPHKCDVCGRCFARPSILTNHRRKHNTDKRSTCEVCGKSVKCLNSHMVSHKIELPHKCDLCNKLFKHKLSLRLHTQRHNNEKMFVCEICGKSFIDKSSLKIHKGCHNIEYNFICPTCGKSYKTNEYLKIHLLGHSEVRRHVCSHCDKRFKSSTVLKRHTLLHTGAKPYVCKVCSKTFRQYGQRTQHMRVHTGETPFVCESCPAAFKYSHLLKKHVKVHHK